MELKTYNADVFSKERIQELCTFVLKPGYKSIFENKKLVDTNGFVPLDVRIKQFILSGEQSKLSAEMFDSDDWRYMFNHVNGNSLEVGDDIEDVSRKLSVVMDRQRELLSRKASKEAQEADTHDRADDAKSEAKSKGSDGSVTAPGEKE